MSEFEDVRRLLRGYRLVTAEILYYMPDYPSLLQSYIWQNYDLPPDYPVLRKFLRFWEKNIDGPLHSVRFMRSGRLLDRTSPFRHIRGSYSVHVH